MLHPWYASKKYLGVWRLNFTNLSKCSIWLWCHCSFRNNIYVLVGGLNYGIYIDTLDFLLTVASIISTFSLFSHIYFLYLFSCCCSFWFSTFNFWLYSTFFIVVIWNFSCISWSGCSNSWEDYYFIFPLLSSTTLIHLMTSTLALSNYNKVS